MYHKLPFTKSQCLQKNLKTFCLNEKQQVFFLKMDKYKKPLGEKPRANFLSKYIIPLTVADVLEGNDFC